MLKRMKKTYKRKYTRKKQGRLIDKGNCFLSETEDKRRRKRLSYFILVLAGLLVVIPCLFFLKTRIEQHMFLASEQEVLKEQNTVTMVMIFYLHQQAYTDYCKSLGVPLVEYPNRFSVYFEKEKALLDVYLNQKRGFGLDQAYPRLQNKFGSVIGKSVEINFNKMATALNADNQEGTILTHKDVCLFLESKADSILQSKEYQDYMSIQNIAKMLSSD